MNIVEKMKADWNRRAAHNAKYWIDVGHYQNDDVFDQAGEEHVAQFLDLLKPFKRSSWQVLDIGCGIGRMVKPMASHFEQVTGVDVSREMVEKGRDWLKNIPNADVLENSGVDLKLFESSQFDLVYSCIAFQHMPREVFESYLAEIHRVLKPGGFLEFQMYVGSYSDPSFEDTLTLRIYDEKELVSKVEKNGFSLVGRREEVIEEGQLKSWILLVQKAGDVGAKQEQSWQTKEVGDTLSDSELDVDLQLVKNHITHGDLTAAEKSLRYLVREHPVVLKIWFELCIFLVENQKAEEAIQTLKEMLDVHPTFYPGYFSLSELLNKSGRHEEIAAIQNLLKEHHKEIEQVLQNIANLSSS
jgi:ubiquinone/menaquinone biosynthesis C-methylase UbiE